MLPNFEKTRNGYFPVPMIMIRLLTPSVPSRHIMQDAPTRNAHAWDDLQRPAIRTDKKRVHFTLITHLDSSWLKTEVSRQNYQDRKTLVCTDLSYCHSLIVAFLRRISLEIFAGYHFNLLFTFPYFILVQFNLLKSCLYYSPIISRQKNKTGMRSSI